MGVLLFSYNTCEKSPKVRLLKIRIEGSFEYGSYDLYLILQITIFICKMLLKKWL